LREHTERVNTAYAAGLVSVWLVLGGLTAAGARQRGLRWLAALVSGLLFPAAWVMWYLADGRLDHKAGR
jgi:hypothetical protein